MSKPQCGECRHFNLLSPGQGQCRAAPPIVQILMMPAQSIANAAKGFEPQIFSAWPTIEIDAWCGQHVLSRPISLN